MNPSGYRPVGRHRTLADFRAHLRGVDPSCDVVEELRGSEGPLGRPLDVDGLRIGNRFCVHPMEGWDATTDGLPTERTLRRWSAFGRSGAKLVWGGEAFAVRADGRANPNQLCRMPDEERSLRGLLDLHDALRAAHVQAGMETSDLVVGLQLTHSGRWSRPQGKKAPRIAVRHPELDRRAEVRDDSALFSDAELESLVDEYLAAARLAQRAGFHFVDVKCCHGYLLHELLGAHTRPGVFGGDFDGRTRLFRTIVNAIRAELPALRIGVRASIADTQIHTKDPDSGIGRAIAADPRAPRYGFGVAVDGSPDLGEPIEFLRLCQRLGVAMVNLTIGSPYTCPHLQRPATYPPSDGYLPPEDPLLSVTRHLQVVRACKRAVPGLPMVGTGYSYLQEWLPYVAEHEVGAGHVDFVGLGRSMLSYPELPADVLARQTLDRRRICRTFSDCTTAPRNGLVSGCYPLDPYYRSSAEAGVLDRIKKEHT
ncbi:MAG: NADH:flavin oxidoreductase [Planctomycetota bacterium]